MLYLSIDVSQRAKGGAGVKKPEPRVRMSVDFSPPVRDAIYQAAREADLSMVEFVRMAMQDYLRQHFPDLAPPE